MMQQQGSSSSSTGMSSGGGTTATSSQAFNVRNYRRLEKFNNYLNFASGFFFLIDLSFHHVECWVEWSTTLWISKLTLIPPLLYCIAFVLLLALSMIPVIFFSLNASRKDETVSQVSSVDLFVCSISNHQVNRLTFWKVTNEYTISKYSYQMSLSPVPKDPHYKVRSLFVIVMLWVISLFVRHDWYQGDIELLYGYSDRVLRENYSDWDIGTNRSLSSYHSVWPDIKRTLSWSTGGNPLFPIQKFSVPAYPAVTNIYVRAGGLIVIDSIAI